MSLRARESICSICAGSSTSQNLSISYIPSEVSGGIYNSSWNLGSPSFNLADQTHLPPAILTSLTEHFLTHLSTFSGAPPTHQPAPALGSPERTSLSIKSPPERGEWRKEGERTLIWLCNTEQFAIGQWNSISFFPFWSISIWRGSAHIVFPQPSAPCIHLQPAAFSERTESDCNRKG